MKARTRLQPSIMAARIGCTVVYTYGKSDWRLERRGEDEECVQCAQARNCVFILSRDGRARARTRVLSRSDYLSRAHEQRSIRALSPLVKLCAEMVRVGVGIFAHAGISLYNSNARIVMFR